MEKTFAFPRKLADLSFWTSFNLAIPPEQPKALVASLGKECLAMTGYDQPQSGVPDAIFPWIIFSCKKKDINDFFFKNIDDQRILQFNWTRALWSITCDLRLLPTKKWWKPSFAHFRANKVFVEIHFCHVLLLLNFYLCAELEK